MKKLYIVGAGGFGREIHAWISQHPDCRLLREVTGFLDDNDKALAPFGDFARVYPLTGHVVEVDATYVCGIGKPELKQKLIGPLLDAGADFPAFVDHSARIGARVKLGRGVVLCPGSVVTTDATIGEFVMINLNSTVGHDAVIGNWTTLSAQCDVTGGARVGEHCFLGSRTTVIPGKSVGDRTVVAAGSVVMTDLPGGILAAGNPARVL